MFITFTPLTHILLIHPSLNPSPLVKYQLLTLVTYRGAEDGMYTSIRSGYRHDEDFWSVVSSELRKLDWDVDAGPLVDWTVSLPDLLLHWSDRFASAARALAKKLMDKALGKPPPSQPLTGYAALEQRSKGEQRRKRNLAAQGQDPGGFVGGNGAAYYSELRAAERAEAADRAAKDQRRQQQAELQQAAALLRPRRELRARPLAPAPRMRSGPPSWTNQSAWARGQFMPRRDPPAARNSLPDPSLVSVGPKPFEFPVAPAGELPSAQAAPVYPWAPAPAVPEQRLEQNTALVRAPEQAAELPCESQPAPVPVYQVVRQVAEPSHVPELAVAVKFPKLSPTYDREVEMLDAPDAAEGETLPEHPAEPASHQVPEESMQVDQTEQAQEACGQDAEPEDPSLWIPDDEVDIVMSNSPYNRRKELPQTTDADSSFSSLGDEVLDATMGNSPFDKTTSELQQDRAASPELDGEDAEMGDSLFGSSPSGLQQDRAASPKPDGEDADMGGSPFNSPTDGSQQVRAASRSPPGGLTQAIPGLGNHDNSDRDQPSRQGEQRASAGSPLMGRDGKPIVGPNGQPIVGRQMTITTYGAPRRPPQPQASVFIQRPRPGPPPPSRPAIPPPRALRDERDDEEDDPVITSGDRDRARRTDLDRGNAGFSQLVRQYVADGMSEDRARLLAARDARRGG